MSNQTAGAVQSAEKPSAIKHIATSFGILVVAAGVFVLIAMLLGLGDIPIWPLVFILLYHSCVEQFDPEKLPMTALSGFIGLTGGMMQGVVSELTGNTTAGLVAFVIFMVVFCTAFVMGDVPWANFFGALILNMMSMFTAMGASGWLGSSVEVSWIYSYLHCAASYLIGVALLYGMGRMMMKNAAKEPVAAED